MNANTGPEPPVAGSDDGLLSTRLAALIGSVDPPPASVVELAKQSFGLRGVDSELAALVADSALDTAGVAVRSDAAAGTVPRLLTFEVGDAAGSDGPQAIELEVSGDGRHRRLLGQLHPAGPGRIEVRQPGVGEVRAVEADGQGRFVVDAVSPGPLSVTWHRPGRRPVTSAWTTLD